MARVASSKAAVRPRSGERVRAMGGRVAISAPAPVAAMSASRAAPKAPPKSPAAGNRTGTSSAVAMAESQ